MADWSSRARFSVPGGDHARAYHLTGTRPGRPTADLVFNFAFTFVQIKLVKELRGIGLLPLARLKGNSLSSQGDDDLVEVTPLSFMDDIVVPATAGDSMQLLAHVEIAASLFVKTASDDSRP